MPRCGRFRTFLQEYKRSPRTNKISFFLPYLILVLELIVLIDAAFLDFNPFIIFITLILVGISSIEIVFVTSEIHNKYLEDSFDKILTIKLDDFITETRENNVKKIVADFIETHPDYYSDRNKIYHTTCQILETHYEEEIEKELTNKLEVFIKQNKGLNVDEIVEKFAKTYLQYKRYRSEIYTKTCKLLEK